MKLGIGKKAITQILSLRIGKRKADTFSMLGRILFTFGIISLSSVSANPFQKINQEIDSSLSQKESATMFRIFGKSPEEAVFTLFATGRNENTSEEDVETASLDLPKYIDVSPVVSNTVVHDTGIILKKYTVLKKDTLSKIAKTFKVDAAKIKKQNNLTVLQPGQVIDIPIQVKSASVSRVIKKKIFILPVPQGRITSRFGKRVDPFNKYNRVFHSGLDLAASVGTPVVASSDGEIIFTGRNGGYGNSIIIQHKDGFKTVYAHCSQILINVGETVKMGRVVATVGRTGTATGAHLHFEVFRNGKLQNPELALSLLEKTVTKLPKPEVAGF